MFSVLFKDFFYSFSPIFGLSCLTIKFFKDFSFIKNAYKIYIYACPFVH